MPPGLAYKVGSFFVVDVHGPGGFWIGVGEALAGTPSRYKHAGVIVGEDGTIVEAEPHGARKANIHEYDAWQVRLCDGPVQRQLALVDPHDARHILDARSESEIRADVAREALRFAEPPPGTPYSFLDYLALAALHLHLPSKAIRRYVKSTGHVICSQLVDAAYLNAGIHLFADGRLPGDVMPSDLADWADDWDAVK